MIYRKLKRTWSHNDLNYIPRFRELFPELKNVNTEDLADRFIDLNLDFYYEEKVPVSWWIRLTLPFALIMMLLMFLFLPINFILIGNWGYGYSEKNRVLNWFKSLRLI